MSWINGCSETCGGVGIDRTCSAPAAAPPPWDIAVTMIPCPSITP